MKKPSRICLSYYAGFFEHRSSLELLLILFTAFKYCVSTNRSPIIHGHRSLLSVPNFNFVSYIVLLFSLLAPPAFASSKLPLPRFAVTKSNEVNARSGPGVRYPTEWVFIKKGEPLEITAEFEQWRYVLDIKGEGGWVHSSVISGKRSVVIIGKEVRSLRGSVGQGARVVAKLEPNLRCQFKNCKAEWCKIKCQSYEGWIERKYIWGVYPNE